MFGAKLDYLLLRPLARRPAEADRTDKADPNAHASAGSGAPWPPGAEEEALEVGAARLRKFNRRVGGGIPLERRLSYLDIGCGPGDMTVALALESGGVVHGVDVNPQYVETARRLARAASLDPARVQFECADYAGSAAAGGAFDVVLSHEALEHYADPRAFLAQVRSMLQGPGARLVMGFGPLFHSPLNVHVTDALKVHLPWCPLLFSERALLRLRSEFWRPRDPVDAWEDVEGGLNRMRYGEFLRWIDELGYAAEHMEVNCQLKRWWPLWALSSALVRAPGLRDYFAASVFAVLRLGRPGAGRSPSAVVSEPHRPPRPPGALPRGTP